MSTLKDYPVKSKKNPCTRCHGRGVFFTKIENDTPIKAKPDNGRCWRCKGSGSEPKKSKSRKGESTMKVKVNFNGQNIIFELGYFKKGDVNLVKKSIAKAENKEKVEKIMTYKLIILLNHLNCLPKGYMTKVDKGHIRYKKVKEMAFRKAKEHNIPYEIITKYDEKNNYVYMILIKHKEKKEHSESA